ncbi:hypothetical protein [Acidilobus sp. 7A]|uniref:hypothetical protein n=1 Tax=Acidilobus sp. 7A TaxID=1577685 RepID=UPI0011E4CBAA|nr:hypothetical protein [Acidilobus sp. 7A]
MLSKLAILTIALFIATAAVGAVGITFYYSYRSTLLTLTQQRPIGSLMSRVSFLEYKIYDASTGGTYFAALRTYYNHTAIIELSNSTGHIIGYVEFGYNSTNITWIYLDIDGLKQNASGSNISSYITPLLTSAAISYNPFTGATSLSGFPGLGPLLGLSYFSNYYNINWRELLNGQQSATDASVGYVFTPVSFNGKNYRGVDITIAPQTSFLGTSGAYSVSASLINLNGVPVATQMVVSTGGANYISMTLINITTT